MPRPLHRGLDLLVQRGRFVGRLDIQFFLQQTPATFVLRQRGRALAGARQRQHQLAVRLLAPRVERKQPGRVADRTVVRAGIQVKLSKRVQRVQRKLSVACALGQHPLFERRRFAHEETGEEVSPIKRRRLL